MSSYSDYNACIAATYADTSLASILNKLAESTSGFVNGAKNVVQFVGG